jgi:tetratricopeptide (TPR) repeat protein
VLTDLARPVDAAALLGEAVPLREELNDKLGALVTYNNIGTIFVEQGDLEGARRTFVRSLELAREVGDRQSEGRSNDRLGMIYYQTQDYLKAEQFFAQAMRIEIETRDEKWQVITLSGLAATHYRLGKIDAALSEAEEAIGLIESMRLAFQTQEFRTSYFGSVRRIYDVYIAALMRQHELNPTAGFDKQAFGASERSRARTFVEMLSESKTFVPAEVGPQLAEKKRVAEQRFHAQLQLVVRNRLSHVTLVSRRQPCQAWRKSNSLS